MHNSNAFLIIASLVVGFFGLTGFTRCSKKSAQAVQFTNNPTQLQTDEHVRICSSVKTIKDEYIPLLNTNVFIKTDANAHGEELADKIENEIKFYHKIFDQFHYYYDDNSATLKNLAILNEYIQQKKTFLFRKIFQAKHIL